MFLGHLLLEEGVEIELKADISDVIALLDSEVRGFARDGYSYSIGSMKGILGSQCKLTVTVSDERSEPQSPSVVGVMEVDKLEGGGVSFRMALPDPWGLIHEEGRLFSGFVFQLLSAFQRRGFIELPERLPLD